MLRPGRTVEEVPRPEGSLLALDEQPALAGQNEECLLISLGVIDAALTRLEDRHVDPELLELDRRLAVLVREPACRAPRFRRPPLGVPDVDDEPALRRGSEAGTVVHKACFGHESGFSHVGPRKPDRASAPEDTTNKPSSAARCTQPLQRGCKSARASLSCRRAYRKRSGAREPGEGRAAGAGRRRRAGRARRA